MREKELAKKEFKAKKDRQRKQQEAEARLRQKSKEREDQKKVENIKELRQNVNSGRGVFQEVRGWANLGKSFIK